jgi:UDP:flavonoid glycosyltransferase YjiC (YdhE family)
MATILFVTIDAGGNTPPELAIAAALRSRGHRILFLGHAQQEKRIVGAGFEFRAFTTTREWNRTRRTSAVHVVSDFVAAATSTSLAQDFLDYAAEQHVDLTVVDCMLLSVVKAAVSIPAPTAVLFHSFYAYWNGPWARGPVARIAQLKRLNARAIWKIADLELVATDPVLDPAGATASARRVWIGNTESGRALGGADAQPPAPTARPKIMVSLSTTWFPGQVDAYRRIVAALADLPVDAIVTTGGMATAEELQPSPNVSVVPFADHEAILPTVSLVVGHGGHSTTMKAVIAGVPVLVIPMHPLMDQPMIGAAIQDAGLGLTVKKRASSAKLHSAIASILGEPHYKATALETAARQRAENGAETGADALLRLIDLRKQSPTLR